MPRNTFIKFFLQPEVPRRIAPVISRTFAILFVLVAMVASANAEPKRVLLLHSFGQEFSPFNGMAERFRGEFARLSGEPADVYEASLESVRFEEGEQEAPIVEYLLALFRHRPLDLIVPIGGPASRFALHHREELFPTTPMLFLGINERLVENTGLRTNYTIVPVRLDLPALVENILNLLPQTKNIAVVIGNSPLEKFWLGEMQREYAPYANRVHFEWLNDLSFVEMKRRVAQLAPDTAILFAILYVDAVGVPQQEEQTLESLHAVANAPIFGAWEDWIGRGIVGGPVISNRKLGLQAAEAAVRIFRGEKPENLKTLAIGPDTSVFDWRELKRWNISEAKLPPTSEIRFRQPGTWEQYRWQISGISAIILLLITLICLLLLERHRRAAAEAESRKRLAENAHMNRRADAGVLSASIAHELAQPLSAVMTNLKAVDMYLKADPPELDLVGEALADVHRDNMRAKEIITHLRTFLKNKEPISQLVDVNEVIRITTAMLKPQAKQMAVDLELIESPSPLQVRVDPVHLQQAVLNLGLNGIEASRDSRRAPRQLLIATGSNGASTAEITVSDSGPGIPSDKLDRIFLPFFTTKRDGMGLGLAIVHQIIETYGGKISVLNRPNGGAELRIALPLAR